MKTKTEIYSIRIKEVGEDGRVVPVLYMVGNKIQSYTGLMTTIERITLGKGLITISFEDKTSRIFGYDPLSTDLFKREVITEKTKTDTTQ
jgi:hypothetical protein